MKVPDPQEVFIKHYSSALLCFVTHVIELFLPTSPSDRAARGLDEFYDFFFFFKEKKSSGNVIITPGFSS